MSEFPTDQEISSFPTDQEISSLSMFAKALFEAESEVLLKEAELREARKRRDTLANQTIPEAMRDMGAVSIETPDCKVVLKDNLHVSPRKDNRPLVFAELEKLGQGALIKSTVTVSFGRGEDEKAKQLIDTVQRSGLPVKQEKKVESQTLKKFVKDRLAAGEEVDFDLFGVRQYESAVFKDGAPQPPIFEGE